MSEFTVIMFKTNFKEKYLMLWEKNVSYGDFQVNKHCVKILTDDFYLFANIPKQSNGNIYLAENKSLLERSIVLSFGWCYKIGDKLNQLDENHMANYLQSHRSGTIPNVKDLSGIYCLISYDHISQSIWICTDMWAQYGFYYGSNSDMIVVSSKAAVVANYLNSNIDGISYLALVRGTAIPSGRSLFSNVWRITCGRGIYLDIKNKVARLEQIQPLYQPTNNVRFNEALNQFVDVVTKVCPFAASQPKTVIDLTGGNDSRIMAAALSSSQGGLVGKQVTFKVVGGENHPDVIIANQIANKFGWLLHRNEREINQDYSVESLQKAAILSDGYHMLPDILRRLRQESQYWGSADGHVGSLGGELFRDFFWRHELQNMGRTKTVNFQALLKYRLYASNKVDVGLISEGKLTLMDHDMLLINPYKMIDSKLPEIKNVYKLDIIYLHKLINKSYSWILSDFQKLILPFLSSEITMVSLRVPWKFRLNRKLVTAAIENIQPSLSLVPSDEGAPMMPLRISTLMQYTRYALSDLYSAYSRHFRKKKLSSKQTSLAIQSQILNIINKGVASKHIYDTRQIINVIKKGKNEYFSKAQFQEIQALLLIELIAVHYKGISPYFSFDGRDANFTEDIITL